MTRKWFDFSYENSGRISPNHSALYLFIVDHCNRLGWKKSFGLPTLMAMEGIGIKHASTYAKTLNDLIEFGFIDMVQKSKNQWTANVVALTKFSEARSEARSKAHGEAHSEARGEADTQHMVKHVHHKQTLKPLNLKTLKLINSNFELVELNLERWIQIEKKSEVKIPPVDEFIEHALNQNSEVDPEAVRMKFNAWKENGWMSGPADKLKPIKNWRSTLNHSMAYFPKRKKSQIQQRTKIIKQTEQSSARLFDDNGNLI